MSKVTREMIYETKCIKTKEELLTFLKEELNNVLENYAKGDAHRPVILYNKAKILADRFYKEVKTLEIPDLSNFWTYGVYLCPTGYKLTMYKEMIQKTDDPNHEYIPLVTPNSEYVLLETNCKMLTIEEYAKSQKATVAATLQNIRRGNVVGATKIGNYWYIPEYSKYNKSVNDDTLESNKEHTYHWNSNNVIFTEYSEILDKCNCVRITKLDNKRRMYHVEYFYIDERHDWKTIDKKDMNNMDKEKLESVLVSTKDVKTEEFVIHFLSPIF